MKQNNNKILSIIQTENDNMTQDAQETVIINK